MTGTTMDSSDNDANAPVGSTWWPAWRKRLNVLAIWGVGVWMGSHLSWSALSEEKSIADAREACASSVAERMPDHVRLESLSTWAAVERSPGVWVVEAHYFDSGRYDSMWCQIRAVGSKYRIARIDRHFEDSRRRL